MAQVFKRESARRDLIAQWVWYADNGDIELADRFLAAVEATLELLSLHPEIGVAIAWAKSEVAGIRRLPVGGSFDNILLFYRVSEEGTELIRVIHGRESAWLV